MKYNHEWRVESESDVHYSTPTLFFSNEGKAGKTPHGSRRGEDVGDRPDFIFRSGSVLALALGDEATDPNLPGILDEWPIGKQVSLGDLPSKFDNGLSLVIATTGVWLVGERLRCV